MIGTSISTLQATNDRQRAAFCAELRKSNLAVAGSGSPIGVPTHVATGEHSDEESA